MTQYLDDSALYYIAFQEAEEGDVDEQLWAKAITLAEGDIDSARYKYIKLRVERLRFEGSYDYHSADSDAAHESASVVPDGYISVSEFAASSAIDKEIIIQNIIDGVWDAQKIQNQWFIPEPDGYSRKAEPVEPVEPVEPAGPLLESERDKAQTFSITATRSLANDEDFAGLEVIAADDAQPPESTPGPVTGPDMQKQRARHGQPDADMDDAISAATEPVTEEIHPKKKKDLVARMASIVARFTAIVAALLLITVVTNVLQQMQLAIEIEFAVHGATAVVLILLLYYVWIKTRIGD